MLPFVFMNIIVPALAGLILERIFDLGQESVKKKIIIVIIITFIVGTFIYLVTPPFRLSGINWCQNETASVSIYGRLTDRFGEDASGETLQIQIFPEGGTESLENAVFATTSMGGQLSVVIPQTHSWSPAQNKYTINFVYWYPHPITGTEQNKKIDKKQGAPFPCSNIVPQSPG